MLRRLAAGLHRDTSHPAGVLVAHPELKGFIALKVDSTPASRMKTIMNGQVAVGMYDDQSRLIDATGLKRL